MPKRKKSSSRSGGSSKRMTTAEYERASAVWSQAGGAGGYSRRKRAYNRSMQKMNMRTAGFLGIEKKFLDSSISAVLLSAATGLTGGELDPTAVPTAMLCLTAPAIGDTETSRDGKQIVGKYLEIKGHLQVAAQADQAAQDTQEVAFLACVLDTQTNAAQLNSEDVYLNSSANAAGNTCPLRNLLFGPRFKILKSGTFVMPVPSTSYDGTNLEVSGVSRNFKWYIPLNDLKINFNAQTTGVISSVIDNSVHMVGFSQQGLALLTYNCRFRFIG